MELTLYALGVLSNRGSQPERGTQKVVTAYFDQKGIEWRKGIKMR